MPEEIEVIATTISGSIHDWGKVKRIQPLFHEQGMDKVGLHVVESHLAAREKARELTRSGRKILISAGGSGTLNSVLEGMLEGAQDTSDIKLGFLRKGSADLLGKTLRMPDEIDEAIRVFVDAIKTDRFVPCDILEVKSDSPEMPPRHFVGYGGAEIFGLVPQFTENRFIKYYKGILSQIFGDLGPFRVGLSLATLTRTLSFPRKCWAVCVDGKPVSTGGIQALVITNGDLGPDMPFARREPLGSGLFHLFIIEDRGILRLPGQIRRTWNGSITDDPERWGYQAFKVHQELKIRETYGRRFPLNVDGSTLPCASKVSIRVSGSVNLIANTQFETKKKRPRFH